MFQGGIASLLLFRCASHEGSSGCCAGKTMEATGRLVLRFWATPLCQGTVLFGRPSVRKQDAHKDDEGSGEGHCSTAFTLLLAVAHTRPVHRPCCSLGKPWPSATGSACAICETVHPNWLMSCMSAQHVTRVGPSLFLGRINQDCLFATALVFDLNLLLWTIHIKEHFSRQWRHPN